MEHELVGRQNGAAIRALREKDRRRVGDFAAQVGLSAQGLRNIENNGKPASKEAILRIADILNVPVAAITRDGTGEGFSEGEAEAEGSRSESDGVAA